MLVGELYPEVPCGCKEIWPVPYGCSWLLEIENQGRSRHKWMLNDVSIMFVVVSSSDYMGQICYTDDVWNSNDWESVQLPSEPCQFLIHTIYSTSVKYVGVPDSWAACCCKWYIAKSYLCLWDHTCAIVFFRSVEIVWATGCVHQCDVCDVD